VNRPLVWVAVAYVAGIGAAKAGVCPGAALPLFLCAAGLGLILFASRVAATRPLSVLLCAFAAGALLWNVRHSEPPGDPLSRYVATRDDLDDNPEWTIEGTVRFRGLAALYSTEWFGVDVDRVTLQGETYSLRGGVWVLWTESTGEKSPFQAKRRASELPPGVPVYAGDRIAACGKLSLAWNRMNFGVSTPEDRKRLQGIHAYLTSRGPSGVICIERAPWWSSPRTFASHVRLGISKRLAEVIPEPALSFVYTVWLGYSAMIDSEHYQGYTVSGTAHIFAVSGLHVAIIFASASWLFRMLLRSRKLRALAIIAVVVIFVMFSGARVSCLRAAFMVIVYVLADLLNRERDAPTALSLSALVLLGWHPDTLFDGAFQLSYLSVASILLFSKPIQEHLQFLPRFLREGVTTSFAVQLLPLPIVISWFHVFPLVSIPANLVVIPLLGVILWLCLFTTLTALIAPQVAVIFGHALLVPVWAIQTFTNFVASLPYSHFRLTSPTLLAILCFGLTLGLCLWALHGRRRSIWLYATLPAILTVMLWHPLTPKPSVDFLDVGHADSICVQSPGGRVLLVDGGDIRNEAGERWVAPFLWSNHIARIDYMVVSHPDADHIGGLFSILDYFEVGQVFMGPETDAELETEFLERCCKRKVPVCRLEAGDTLDLGGMKAAVLHPAEDWPSTHNVNDQSLVLRLDWDQTRILLTGDIEKTAEAVVGAEACGAELLKVPHHGSKTSSSPAFLEAVNPQHAIVSTGKMWGRKPMPPEIADQYRAAGIRLWRTDHLGGIRVVKKNGETSIQCVRETRGYPHWPAR